MSEFDQVLDDGKKGVKSWLKKGLALLLLLGLIAGGAYIWVSGWTYSKGTRAGHLVKLSKKGVVWKTFEGQLNLGGFESNDQGISGNIWNFSVPKKETYKLLEKHEGKDVKLLYREVYKNMPWQGKTQYMVYDIEVLE